MIDILFMVSILIADYIFCLRNLNEVSIKYQLYPKLRKIDAFGQEMWFCHNQGCGGGRFFRIPTPTPDSDSSSFEKPTPDSDSSSFKKPTPTPDSDSSIFENPTPTPDSSNFKKMTPTPDSDSSWKHATPPTPTPDSITLAVTAVVAASYL